MSSSSFSDIPIEYQRIFSEIPEGEIASFNHSLNISDQNKHQYLKIADAIESTLMVYTEPSPYWHLILGRISVVSTRYDELLALWEIQKYHGREEFAPFVARVLTFQNQYEEAIEICKATLEKLDPDHDIHLLNVVILFETYFTLGLAYAYTRQFEEAERVIQILEGFSTKYIYKRTITESYFLDYVFYENIIRAYTAFFSSKPKEMLDVLNSMIQVVENVKDPWIQGFYYNVYGISQIMSQELNNAEIALRKAFRKFELVNDLRGYSTVGANLGVSLISKGQRNEGREYLESIIGPLAKMKNYWLAVGNTLLVAKSYMEEKKLSKTRELLEWAEGLTKKADIAEPNIFSMFSYFYAKIGDLDKSGQFLFRLQTMAGKAKDGDTYAKTYYLQASSVNAMVRGDLNTANNQISEGIQLADQAGYFNQSYELTMLQLEIILKQYIVDSKEATLLKAAEILADLSPLIELTDAIYIETLFYLVMAYIYLAMNNRDRANELFERASDLTLEHRETAQYEEIVLFEQRLNFINKDESMDTDNALFREFMGVWLSDEYLPIFYTMEAMRLLGQLQFEQTNIGQQQTEEKLPLMLIILGYGGTTVYTYRFREDVAIDEVLVGGFLSALTSFSQELFGGGMLSRVDQGNHVLLLERITDENILILIVDKETYMLRKKFKRFSEELSSKNVVEYLPSDVILSEFDPQYQIIEGLVEIVFLGPESNETVETQVTE